MTRTTAATFLSSEIIELLLEMGLTRTEVQVYQYLLTFKSAIPSAIARDTGQARGRIYEGMRALVEKGFAREEPTRPIQFFPTPLSEILSAVQARLTQQLAAVTKGQALAATTAAVDVPPPLRPMRMRDVRVLSGRRSCFAEMTRMLETARRSFWLMGGGRFGERLANMPNLLENLRSAAERGVDVQIIVPKASKLPPALVDLGAGPGGPTLHQASADTCGPLVACTTETTSLEIVAQPDDERPNRGDDVAIQVTNDLFAVSVQRRFDLARSFFHADAPAPVFQWMGANHGSDLFLDAVRSARQEVVVLGPREWSNYLGVGWDRTASLFDAARSNGVRFRALAARNGEPEGDLERFTSAWEVRVAPSVPLWLTIVDGRELYQAFTHATLGGPPQFRRSIEEHEVRFYLGLFERMWDEGRPLEGVPVVRHNPVLGAPSEEAVAD